MFQVLSTATPSNRIPTGREFFHLRTKFGTTFTGWQSNTHLLRRWHLAPMSRSANGFRRQRDGGSPYAISTPTTFSSTSVASFSQQQANLSRLAHWTCLGKNPSKAKYSIQQSGILMSTSKTKMSCSLEMVALLRRSCRPSWPTQSTLPK